MAHPFLTLPLLLCLGQASEPAPVEAPVQARLSFVASQAAVEDSTLLTYLHAALDVRTPELASGLRAEAALSMFFSTGGNNQGVAFRDNGSAIRLRYRPSTWESREGLALSVFPLSATRVYMGFSYPVTWERQSFPRRDGNEPALELRLSRRQWSVFAATKAASVLNDLKLTQETRYALLAGGALEVTPELGLALKVTHLNRGVVPGLANQGIEESIPVYGASLAAAWHRGAPIGNNVDLSLYSGDPTFFERFFLPETYPGDFAASVSLEGSLVSQRLQDVDEFAQMRSELGQAAALDARLKQGFFRLHALAFLRTASFIQVDVPGFPNHQAFGRDADPRAEVSGTLSGDYHFADWGLTPGLLVRVALPATFQRPLSFVPGATARHIVLQGPNQLSILPDGEDRRAVLTLKATARWDLGSVAGVLAEVSYVRDPNRTTFEDDVTGVGQPVFADPDALGFNLLLQARF
ncbi:hypothetical protein D7X74_27675 [Corallococcus sp. CA047B]|uniref:hypothetical protein n=1 Tax=Corallococcus sp. CA047B TaxID=2316729 RepID=UPI000EA32ACE|nr:hypothetical protein [Corallococcus sp. CA047B]RKH10378.1 hypothetical protein D7X74_27675 [Corallococcus sp. CA047B]